jgi:vanillate O-demethylase monooxygenase subunit
MYPFADDIDTFAMNRWYIAAWSSEVTKDKPFERWITGKRLVFYRKQDGTPVALDGLCSHRQFPLAKSDVVNDQIVCKYHGFTFGSDGGCTKIPTQQVIPPTSKLQSYKLVETWKWIWIWPGDQALADESMIPDHHEISLLDPGFEAIQCFAVDLKGRYQLLHENLLDLSHLSFLHADQMGIDEIAQTPVEIEEHKNFLRNKRVIPNVPLSPVFVRMSGYTANVDRSVFIDYYYPSLHVSLERWDQAGHAWEDDKLVGQVKIYHGVTPATKTTTTYFAAVSRSFHLGDEELNQMMIHGLRIVIAQDETAIEAIEEVLTSGDKLRPDVLAKGDVVAMRGRRLLENMIRAEKALKVAAE